LVGWSEKIDRLEGIPRIEGRKRLKEKTLRKRRRY
jgi:hypothetical protein